MRKGVVQIVQNQPAVATNKNSADTTTQINDTHTKEYGSLFLKNNIMRKFLSVNSYKHNQL
ncbi:MAG: hypothetical protein SOU27_00285 [Sodaliphilus sp.]|nr:hypothetical protein [Sodaliphilus sp.]